MNETIKNEKVIPFWKIIYKRLVLIILITALCGVIGFGYSYLFKKPIYTATKSVILKLETTTNEEDNSNRNATIAKIYLPTIKEMITSPRLANNINDKITGKKTAENSVTSDSISVTYSEDSLVFTIAYSDYSMELAEKKLELVIAEANELVDVPHMVNAKNVDIKALQEEATPSDKNSYAISTIIGSAIGLVLGVAVAFLIYFLDNTAKDKEEMEELLGVPVISKIDNFN